MQVDEIELRDQTQEELEETPVSMEEVSKVTKLSRHNTCVKLQRSFLQESVGPDGLEGYGQVTDLAEFLVELETCLHLTNAQARKCIQLWEKLSPHDKKPITFPPRHRARLTQGRFKSSKSSVAPGVDSTRRYTKKNCQQNYYTSYTVHFSSLFFF